MDIGTPKNLAPFVENQFPLFVKMEHPTLVAFVQAYYEWLQNNDTIESPLTLRDVSDIDSTFDEFVDHFKKTFLLDFPETLAVSQKTGNPVNVRTLVKNIRDFYEAKGTEKTYELLFRILYDTNVEFYYPKVDLLRVSDGKWVQKKSLKISSSLGKSVFTTFGKTIKQIINGSTVASAIVQNITKYQTAIYDITEVELSNVNGTFVAEHPIVLGDLTEVRTYSVTSSISISSRGLNYRVGDRILFTNAANDFGQGAAAEVSQVSSTGQVLKIKITNFGVNYRSAPTITIDSEKGYGFVGSTVVGALCNHEGYYANNDGRLSSNKVLQDNHYYQNYSYVLKSEVTISKYRDIVKRLIHPAGLGFFGQISIKRCVESELHSHSSLLRYEVPLIGHYTPYTFETYDDLAEWFTVNGIQYGYAPAVHDAYIQYASGNPLSYPVQFIPYDFGALYEEGFPRADPFWIIYHHPNTRITGSVPIRVNYNQLTDFITWSEWQLTGDNRTNWINSFTGGTKYTTVRYDTSSAFKKISIGSFLTMPIGEEFDCRASNGVLHDWGGSPNF